MQITVHVTKMVAGLVSHRYHPGGVFRRFAKPTRLLPALLLCLLASAAAAAVVPAQDKPPSSAAVASAQTNPLSAVNRRFYGGIKSFVLLSAEKTPEEHYGFKPTVEARYRGCLLVTRG